MPNPSAGLAGGIGQTRMMWTTIGKDTMELDLCGLRCPMPALRTEKALRTMATGERLTVLTDDPLAGLDIPALCRAGGHVLVSTENAGGGHRFLIERGGEPSSSE